MARQEKPGQQTPPIAEKTRRGRLRSAAERTIPMFPLAQLAPHEAEARAIKERLKAEAKARRKAAKKKREAEEEAVKQGIKDFNERVGA